MNNDLKQYLGLFGTEAKGHIQNLNTLLVKLEKSPTDQAILYEIMRAGHTLKGMNATMGFAALQELGHKIEDIFDAARKGTLSITKIIIDKTLNAVDVMEDGIKKVLNGEAEPDTKQISEEMQNLFTSASQASAGVAPKVEIKEDIPVFPKKKVEIEKIKDINVPVERLDKLMNLAEELIISKMHFNLIDQEKNYKNLRLEIDKLERLSQEFEYHITQSRMVEVGQIFGRFPRMIRDLAIASGKDISLEIEGEEIKLDRNIVDELGEPLVHLLRNAVDHGISKSGTIRLVAKRDKNIAVIEVSDNGGGLDLERIKQVAIEKKIATEEEIKKFDDKKVMELIYHPLLSTSEKVTEISGRGVGMAAVKSKVEALNGLILIESEKGKGTKFSMQLPLSLAIIQALLVKVGDQHYAIPTSFIERNVNFEPHKIKKGADVHIAILDGEDVPLLYLHDQFKIEKSADKQNTLAVIASIGRDKVGLVVDEIIQEGEMVVKSLSKLLRSRKEFSGITILGNGKTVLILDVQNLI